MRILAVDWSGARTGGRSAICLAEARAGTIVRLESGRDREEVTRFLLAEARRDPELVVGLDFAFSVPEWFARSRGAGDVRAVWALVERDGEQWLREPQPPFWRARKPRLGKATLRRTEVEVAGPGIRPKSVFQLGGAGNVGTGSLRGMPLLARLAERFAVWPFDEPRLPLAVEIYPRLFTASGWAQGLGDDLTEHARDAAASALAMAAWTGDWLRLPREECYLLEGRIWPP